MATDPGHLLPDEDWAAVVADAELQARRIAAGEPAAEAARGFGTGALPLSGVVTARSHGSRRAGGPTFGVLHSAETPLAAGYAAGIARYFRDKAATSCHYMTDPAETWGVLPDELVAWHCGNGNSNSVALEQAGYARLSRAEWLSPAGRAQMARNAAVMRACRDRYGIGLYAMTDAQLLAAHRRQIVGGWATHDQCRRVLKGTDHTDPGGGFPLDVQLAMAGGATEDDVPTQAEWDELSRRVSLLLDVELAPRDPRERTPGEQAAAAAIENPELARQTGGPQALSPVLAEVFTNTRAVVAGVGTLLARPAADVDERELAAALGPLLPALVAQLPTEQLERIAELVNDVRDRRERDGDPATGPVS